MVATEARILCVDDEPGLLGIISHFLKKNPGFQVDTATSAKEALGMMVQAEYDAIVVDYLMPEMNGLELLKELRSTGNDIPFIMLTGKGNEDVAVDALNQGADFYVQKGTDPKDQFAELSRLITESVSQRRSHESLLKTTHTLQAVIQSSPVPIFALDPRGIVLLWNRASERVFGWKAEEVVGKPVPIVPLEAMEEFKALRGRVLEGESFAGLELKRQRKDGRLIDLLVWTAPLRDERGRVTGIMASAQEITGQKEMESKLMRVNRLYALLSSTNAAIVRLHSRQTLFDEICRIAVEKGEFRAAWIGMLDEETQEVKPVALYGKNEGIGTTYRIFATDAPEGQGPTGKAVRLGRLFTSSDIENDPDMVPWRTHAALNGIRSAAAIPLRLKGKVVGALAIRASEPGFFRDEEKTLLEEIGSDVSFALDSITREEERRRAQSALRKEAAFTAITLDTAGALIVVIDREGKIVRFNKEAELVTRYTAEEVIGKKLLELFIPPEHAEKVKASFAEILAGRYPVECDCDWLAKDGSRRKIEWTKTALPEKDGSVRFVIATGIDVTEKRRTQERLRESEEQLRLVTDNMIDMLARTDAVGSYVYVSPSHKVQMGWDPGDLLGKKFSDFIHPDDIERVLKDIDNHLATGSPMLTMTFRSRRADGTYVWVESSGRAIIDEQGRLLGAVFGTRDISIRRNAEEKLEKRTVEAEQAKLKAQTFLDFMSHDISNIVTPMLTYANLISESDKVPQNIKKYASRIEDQIRSVGMFTTNVRKLSHAELEAHTGFAPLDLRTAFADAVRLVAARHPDTKIDVKYSLPEGPVVVPGAQHLEDVVEHVIENATVHCKKEQVEIEVAAKVAGDNWEVAVSDNGPGIPDSKKKMIVMNSALTQSSFARGIASGLSFSGLIVEQLGGSLRVEDRVPGDHSKGARIVLTLPVVGSAASADAKTTSKSAEQEVRSQAI